eukprot:COSAG01_NODE_1833_length_9107_cov_7.147313_2_plen_93_part_00
MHRMMSRLLALTRRRRALLLLESTAAIMWACSARGACVCGWLLAGCMLLHALDGKSWPALFITAPVSESAGSTGARAGGLSSSLPSSHRVGV